jgi:hypothetical protein
LDFSLSDVGLAALHPRLLPFDPALRQNPVRRSLLVLKIAVVSVHVFALAQTTGFF